MAAGEVHEGGERQWTTGERPSPHMCGSTRRGWPHGGARIRVAGGNTPGQSRDIIRTVSGRTSEEFQGQGAVDWARLAYN